MRDCTLLPAGQQPTWDDIALVRRVRASLAVTPGLVRGKDVAELRRQLAAAATGEAVVVQAGDCAESFAESLPGHVARKAALLDILAGELKMITHRPVIRAARIAGQYAKPRSRPTERVGGHELPVYRGHMVNGPEPDPLARRPDPRRMLAGYRAARAVVGHLGWPDADDSGVRRTIDPAVWTSHEALLLDYELPMLRGHEGRPFLASTHWPWIGERTRDPAGAHVALLSRVANPVACKVGPRMTTDELLTLCELLDPAHERGRLTLIARMGHEAVAEKLPPLVAATVAAGHPVLWLTDPMHGNTVTVPGGHKTRLVHTVVREVRLFHEAVRSAGGVAGGLHLETTPDDVTECVPDAERLHDAGRAYTSLCDPRLNPSQAVAVISAWRG
ncbi:3-deoxy-7-phosphoheptulonate synthase [Mangrovihabitans endophyticus]|uniref:3-deoxy-7-phosphoheptulonate synthase n=1 Tax=Mangrovihabitans endophyticus TaxID=1751298 RepID=UPI0027BA7BFF|nr:3-deoxy-7-phosphoheptulonate synthase [Mangrovihabitans endophyticus]